jgi:hypothetical protein
MSKLGTVTPVSPASVAFVSGFVLTLYRRFTLFQQCFCNVLINRTRPVRNLAHKGPAALENDMKHDWMIRALEDLQAYAAENRLPALAAHLDEAKLLAFTEAASRKYEIEVRPIEGLREKVANYN